MRCYNAAASLRDPVRRFLFAAVAWRRASRSPDRSGNTHQRVRHVIGVPEGNVAGRRLGRRSTRQAFSASKASRNNGVDGRRAASACGELAWENDGLRLRVTSAAGVLRFTTARPFDCADCRRIRSRGDHATEATGARYPVVRGHHRRSTARRAIELVSRLSRPVGVAAGGPDSSAGSTGTTDVGTGPYRDRQAGDVRRSCWKRSTNTTLAAEDRARDRAAVRHTANQPGPACFAAKSTWSTTCLQTRWSSSETMTSRSSRSALVPVSVAFNSRTTPLSNRRLVRKALNMAVDRAGDRQEGPARRGEAVGRAVLAEALGLRFGTVPAISFDPAGAAALLDAAGYPLPKASGDATGRRRGFGSHACSRRISPCWNASRWKFKGALSMSASTCSSRSCRSTEFNAWFQRAIRRRAHRHDQRSDACAAVHLLAVARRSSKGLQCLRLRERRSGAAVRDAACARRTKPRFARPVEAAAGASTTTRRRCSSPGTTRARAINRRFRRCRTTRPRPAVDDLAMDVAITDRGRLDQ